MKNLNLVIILICCSCTFGAFRAEAQYTEVNIDTLIQELGIRESREPSRDMEGWSRPKKITMQFSPLAETGFGSKQWLLEVADGVKVEFVRGGDELRKSIVDSDAYFGGCSEVILSGKELDYIHIGSAGIDRCTAIPELKSSKLIATNTAKVHSETIAEHSIALMLALARNIATAIEAQAKSEWSRSSMEDVSKNIALKDKTILILGLGGIGTQVASRAHSLGMRVIGTRNSSRNGPDYVDYVGLSDETNELAKQADVVVNALPLTSTTRGIAGTDFFNNLKKGSYYISVGRGPTTDTEALMAALKNGKLNGAGLDVTDPEPLPKGHELWSMPNVIITPHVAGWSDLTTRNRAMVIRENLRRYIQGEKLINMVDLARGY